MLSIRVLSLSALAAISLALPAYVAFGQPDTKPTPAPAPTPAAQPPADPPKGDPKPGDAPGRGPAGQPGQPGGRGQRGGDGGMPQTTKQGMSVMNRALRTLKSQVADATKKEDNLKLVADMQRGCLGAKSVVPDRLLSRETEPAKKDEITTKYRKDLITMMQKLLALETAIIDGKADAANKLVDEIDDLRDSSHQDLGVRG